MEIEKNIHQAIVQEIVEQRDRFLNEALQKGADLRLAIAKNKELQERLDALQPKAIKDKASK